MQIQNIINARFVIASSFKRKVAEEIIIINEGNKNKINLKVNGYFSKYENKQHNITGASVKNSILPYFFANKIKIPVINKMAVKNFAVNIGINSYS